MPGKPCLPIPIPAAPEIPAPFSLEPPVLPQPEIADGVCCQSVNLGAAIPPIPLPPLVLNPGVVGLLRQGVGVALSLLDNLPIDCPRQ